MRAAALARSSRHELAGVADADPAHAVDLARRYSVTPYDIPEIFAAGHGAEAVIVSTPPASHHELALAAFAAGKHVLCEKPLAAWPGEARDILAAAAAAGRIVATGFNQRYFPALAELQRLVGAGDLGDLRYVKAYAGHRGDGEFRESWMGDAEAIGGGTLMDNGIHIVDLVQRLLGDVAAVQGRVSPPGASAETDAFATLMNSAGVTAQIHSSWTAWRGYRFWVEAYGGEGTARASYSPMWLSVVPRRGGRRERFYASMYFREKLWGWQSSVQRAFAHEHDAFAARVAGERDGALATGEEGLRAVEIAHAVYASAASGEAVTLSAER